MISQCTLCHGRKKNNVDKDNLNESGDGLQINQKLISKKNDEVEEDDDDETIVMSTEHQGLKIKLRDKIVF